MSLEVLPDWEEPDEAQQAESVDLRADDAALHEAMVVAMQTAIVWLIIGAIALLPGMFLLAPALSCVTEDLENVFMVSFGRERVMPTLLFALFGVAYGTLLGWRMASGAGLVGWPAWVIGSAAILALALIGGVFACFVLSSNGLVVGCVSLVVMAALAIGAMGVRLYWGA